MAIKLTMGTVLALLILGGSLILIAPDAQGCSGCPAPDLETCFLMCDAELDRCIDGGWGGDGNYCMAQYEACEDDCIAHCS